MDNLQQFLVDNTHKIPKNFDWQFYISYHKDVYNRGFTTEDLAKYHYVVYGKTENRIYHSESMIDCFISDEQTTSNSMAIFIDVPPKELLFAGYHSFFNDISLVIDQFDEIIIIATNINRNNIQTFPLYTKYPKKIKFLEYQNINKLKYEPKIIYVYNSYYFLKAKNHFNTTKIIYYCQEYEAGFHPFGDKFLLSEKAIYNSKNLIISTSILENYLKSKNLIDHKKQNILITQPKIDLIENITLQKTKNIFFYFRPERWNSRNLPYLILNTAKIISDKYPEYNLYLGGATNLSDIYHELQDVSNNIHIRTKMTYKDYTQHIADMNLVVALIYSAHPGVIPFQSAMSGIPSITNIYDNRDKVYLSKISKNLFGFDPIKDKLETIIDEALCYPKGDKEFNMKLYADITSSIINFQEKILT